MRKKTILNLRKKKPMVSMEMLTKIVKQVMIVEQAKIVKQTVMTMMMTLSYLNSLRNLPCRKQKLTTSGMSSLQMLLM